MPGYELFILYANHFNKYLPAMLLVAIALSLLSFIMKTIKRSIS